MSYLDKSSLKTLLAGAMTLALFLVILLSSYVNISGFSSLFYNVTEKEHLPNVVKRAKAEIESELRPPIALSQSIAQNYFMHDWISEGEPQAQLPDVINYMQRYVDENNASAVFWVVNQSQNYYTQEGLFKQVSKTNPRDEWFFNFLNSNKEIELNLDPNEKTKALTVFVNVKARGTNGMTIGAAGLGYDVSNIIQLVEEVQVGENGYMFLVNGSGQIVAHRNSGFINKNVSELDDYKNIAENIVQSGIDYNLFERSINDVETYGATVGLDGVDWKLVTVFPKSEIDSQVNDVIWTAIITAVILAILFISLAIFIANGVSKNITEVGDKLKVMSESGGDLTQRLDDRSQNELGYLAGGFNAILSKFTDLVKETLEAEKDINRGVANLRKTANESVKHSESQRQQTEMVASAINQMGETIKEVSSVAHATAEDTESAVKDTHETNEVMQRLSITMDELADSMKKSETSISDLASQAESINSVVDVISSISEQTNLLALNAAIEAARAGEQGRGFAVVADEVRTLASRTQDSTNEIRTQIERLQSATSVSLSSIKEGAQRSMDLAESAKVASSSLASIRNRFDSISEGNHQVAAATEQQSTVVNHINESAQQINDMANNISEIAQSQISEVNTLMHRAEHMREIVQQFKV